VVPAARAPAAPGADRASRSGQLRLCGAWHPCHHLWGAAIQGSWLTSRLEIASTPLVERRCSVCQVTYNPAPQ